MLAETSKAEQGNLFEVYNPATGEKLATLPAHSTEEVEEAVQRLRIAQADWAKLSFQERGSRLYKLRRLMLEHREALMEVLVAESGKPRFEALGEILYLSDIIGYYVKNSARFLAKKKIWPHLLKTKRTYITYHPVGVVGVIAPWNYPLVLTFGDSCIAWLAGNAVALKPSEVTPLTALKMAEFCKEAKLPLEIMTGQAETGAALIDAADLIAFTGSVATGKKVMERAAKTLTPVLLELGGKDPMIVLKDANLTRAVNAALYGSLCNTGQNCIAVERIYVEEPIYEQFIAKLLKGVATLRQGIETAGKANIELGPMTMPRQLEIVERQVADARAKGAKILTGGQRRTDLPGNFYEPTILTDVTEEMLIMQEETFGPLLPIIKVRDAEEAVRQANHSRFGLSSSIWTSNTAKGEALAQQIEAGATCINDILVNYLIVELPFGGIKESGIGTRHGGAEGIRKFCRTQAIVVDRFQFQQEVNWFPYNKKKTRLLSFIADFMFKRGQ
ncbi:MAG: aldehyde dehydrogenase family protein [Chloroflexi bacterium]|nr:aldehyde dehydrogenase family protein [Chloroflexota bacterium]